MMLRITVRTNPELTILKVEGRLASVWVHELRRCARSVLSGVGQNAIALDLTNVTFVDVAGKRLLTDLANEGVRLISDDPVMDALVDEIGAHHVQMHS